MAYLPLMDPEKAYDRVDGESFRNMCGIYNTERKVLPRLKNFYTEGRACVRVPVNAVIFLADSMPRRVCGIICLLLNISVVEVLERCIVRRREEG